MNSTGHLPIRLTIATGLAALALLAGGLGVAKSASVAAPPSLDRVTLVATHHPAQAAVAGVRGDLEGLAIEEGEVHRPIVWGPPRVRATLHP
jgi:hypothetical protein